MKPLFCLKSSSKRRVRLGRRAHARAMVNPRARGGIILNRDRRICDAHVISPAMFLIALGHRRCSHNVGTGSKVKRSQILQPRKSRSTEIGYSYGTRKHHARDLRAARWLAVMTRASCSMIVAYQFSVWCSDAHLPSQCRFICTRTRPGMRNK